jgi:hypothetical protein
MTDSSQSRSRLPHWGWWLLATILLAVGFAGVSIWLPWYREQQAIQKIEEWGGQVETRTEDPEWLRDLVGKDRLNDAKLFVRAVKVQMSGQEIGDRQIAQLSALTRLQGLDLRRTAVTDAGVAHLRGLTDLKYLILDRTAVTDNGLVHLNRLPNLRTVSLDRTAVTDKGLLHLSRSTNLKRLHVVRTQVTDNGVAELHKALPDCEILF